VCRGVNLPRVQNLKRKSIECARRAPKTFEGRRRAETLWNSKKVHKLIRDSTRCAPEIDLLQILNLRSSSEILHVEESVFQGEFNLYWKNLRRRRKCRDPTIGFVG
jgi:hypothetical protein